MKQARQIFTQAVAQYEHLRTIPSLASQARPLAIKELCASISVRQAALDAFNAYVDPHEGDLSVSCYQPAACPHIAPPVLSVRATEAMQGHLVAQLVDEYTECIRVLHSPKRAKRRVLALLDAQIETWQKVLAIVKERIVKLEQDDESS